MILILVDNLLVASRSFLTDDAMWGRRGKKISNFTKNAENKKNHEKIKKER